MFFAMVMDNGVSFFSVFFYFCLFARYFRKDKDDFRYFFFLSYDYRLNRMCLSMRRR